MTTIAHAVSASYLGLILAGVDSNQTELLLTAVVSASVADLDHPILLISKRKYFQQHGYQGNLHQARSPLHELWGFFLVGLLTACIAPFDSQLASVIGVPYMIHITQDMIVGVSYPLAPIDKTSMQLMPQKMSLKIFLDFITILIFCLLWMEYLNVLG